MRKLLFPLVIGLGGIAILLWLGVWQVNRLGEKEAQIANIEAKLAAEPVTLPDVQSLDPVRDNYLTVIMQGTPLGEELRFLNSGTAAGTGHQIISAFETETGRRVLLDQGLLPLYADPAEPMRELVTVQGNLIWPDDATDQAPVGDEWYARDVAAMAAVLDTEPVLVVLSAASEYDARLTPLPVTTRGIKNDHLEYAITWFLLAVVWLVMTGLYMARSMRQKES